jgi:leucine dehydrogenase
MKPDFELSCNPVISQMSSMDHDQILFCSDNQTGLKAIIAIHDTTLGPALGGTKCGPIAMNWKP